ncbi:sigma-70 family RNA polymerase sigma factor [Microbacterium trichothecenolyticum]|nr:sigma-70 family RNA polymerase sigma factor [Microbacterium trichothecenolyticum]
MRDALDRLPEGDAELIRLIYWDGLRSHEVAKVLGINPSTVRSRLSRAKEQLRGSLENRRAIVSSTQVYEPRPSDVSLPAHRTDQRRDPSAES